MPCGFAFRKCGGAQRQAYFALRDSVGSEENCGSSDRRRQVFLWRSSNTADSDQDWQLAATPTGATGKSDERACHEALHWTLVALEKRAQQAGANAVVNIVSFYGKNELSSATMFECHVGNVIVSVFLRGDLVKITDPRILVKEVAAPSNH